MSLRIVCCTACLLWREHHARGMCRTCYARSQRRVRVRTNRVSVYSLTAAERDREYVVRAVVCPLCGAAAGGRCADKRTGRPLHLTSHEARYNVAARCGLVPALAGVS